MRFISLFIAILTICYFPANPISHAKSTSEIRNIILLIGDGMGPHYTSAYRYYRDNKATPEVEKTSFDLFLVGMQMTYPLDPDENITNSAAAGTALFTGHKTYNNAIGVDHLGNTLKTVLEKAKEENKSTGLVVTSQLTHATPASFGAHNLHRKNMKDIADQYFDEKINGVHKIDVLLGGGKNYFHRKDRNLIQEFRKDGYSYVTNSHELLQDQSNQVLGLFSAEEMPKMIDRHANIPSLREMTISAIDRLNHNKNGFFLMVEGSQIDFAGHDQDIVAAMSEMEDFEEAFKAAIEFAQVDQHTLVIATADHSTGGFTIGANDIYNWFPEPIKAAKRTPDYIAKKILQENEVDEILEDYIDFTLTKKELKAIRKAAKSKDIDRVDQAIEDIFTARTNTGWTTEAHTGEDVPIYAYGPYSEQLHGQINNTEIAKLLFNVLENK
ncbi:alkaline phosphatase [Bacillus pinisoli]|uniref:alkaline phosphatase n=1 Tax=Bacillus pinisoli TaxID=2901866 RepID=UPI001FF64CFE|nr:alkaline phosphatase [Bacillus pinisoli]